MGFVQISQITLDPVYSGPGNPPMSAQVWYKKSSLPDTEGNWVYYGQVTIFPLDGDVSSPIRFYEEDVPGGGPVTIRMKMDCRPEYYYSGPYTFPATTQAVTTIQEKGNLQLFYGVFGLTGSSVIVSAPSGSIEGGPLTANEDNRNDQAFFTPTGLHTFICTIYMSEAREVKVRALKNGTPFWEQVYNTATINAMITPAVNVGHLDVILIDAYDD